MLKRKNTLMNKLLHQMILNNFFLFLVNLLASKAVLFCLLTLQVNYYLINSTLFLLKKFPKSDLTLMHLITYLYIITLNFLVIFCVYSNQYLLNMSKKLFLNLKKASVNLICFQKKCFLNVMIFYCHT